MDANATKGQDQEFLPVIFMWKPNQYLVIQTKNVSKNQKKVTAKKMGKHADLFIFLSKKRKKYEETCIL